MHISHDFIATKTCPSYEFLVIFRQVWVWDWKSAGREQVGMVCGVGAGCAGKISQTPLGAGLNFAGARWEWTQNFNPHRTLTAIHCL